MEINKNLLDLSYPNCNSTVYRIIYHCYNPYHHHQHHLHLHLYLHSHSTILIQTTNQIKTMEQQLPWIEKYRPTKLDELVSQDDIVSTINRLIDAKQLPHLLFYGPPGSGKTSLFILYQSLCLLLFIHHKYHLYTLLTTFYLYSLFFFSLVNTMACHIHFV